MRWRSIDVYKRQALRFTAGDVSVTETEGSETAKDLRKEAKRLMAPYVKAENFSVRGVRG